MALDDAKFLLDGNRSTQSIVKSYCQELCTEGSRGVLCDPEAILQDNAVPDLRHVMRGPSPRPPLGGTLRQFAPHREPGDAGEASPSLVRTGAPRGTRGFDGRRRATVAPGLRGNVIKSSSDRASLGEARGGLGRLGCRRRHAAVTRSLGTRAVWRPPEGLEPWVGLRLWRARRRSGQDCALSRSPSQRPLSAVWPLGGAPLSMRSQCRAASRRVAPSPPAP